MKKTIIYSTVLITLLFVFTGGIFAAEKKPNVLFIVLEDTHWNVFGSYGNPICKTPNIDKLAQSGVLFERAYCQGSACNATRTSFINGLRPATTRLWHNGQRIRDVLPEGVRGMPELFKEAGYTTIDIGKFYHTTDFSPKQVAFFDRIEHNKAPEGWQGPPPILEFPPAQPDWNKKAKSRRKGEPQNPPRNWYSDSYGDSGFELEQEGDRRSARIAVALLEEFAGNKNKDENQKPFFLVLGQGKPHTPYISPTKFATLYDPAKIPDPPAQFDTLKDFPYIVRATVGGPDIFTETPSTPQGAKEAIAAYYGCVTFVDENLGLVFDALEKTGLDKETIVVLIGDHGVHLGDHNIWSKYTLLEGTHHAPLIVRVPGVKENGKRTKEFVEFVDLLPTFIDYCGLKDPGNLEGISFRPLLEKDVATPWKKAAFLTDHDFGHAIRTSKYRYTEFGEKARWVADDLKAALYDVEKDPEEVVNLINDPAYDAVKKELADLLHKGWKEALPPGYGK